MYMCVCSGNALCGISRDTPGDTPGGTPGGTPRGTPRGTPGVPRGYLGGTPGAPRGGTGEAPYGLFRWRHYRLFPARGGGLNPTGVLPRNAHADSTPPLPIAAQVQDSCTTRVQLVYNSYRTHTYNSSQKQIVFEHTHARIRKIFEY